MNRRPLAQHGPAIMQIIFGSAFLYALFCTDKFELLWPDHSSVCHYRHRNSYCDVLPQIPLYFENLSSTVTPTLQLLSPSKGQWTLARCRCRLDSIKWPSVRWRYNSISTCIEHWPARSVLLSVTAPASLGRTGLHY